MDQNKKIIFIPGWMYSPDYFKSGEGLNIWKDGIDFSKTPESEFLVGHSLGAAVALKMWLQDKNKKLILVNPFLGGKSFGRMFFNWIRFSFDEGFHDWDKHIKLSYLPKNIKYLIELAGGDYLKILKEIPRENIKILHGEKDLYLCGQKVCNKLKEMRLEIHEVVEAGHNWHENFEKEIKKIIE